MKRSKKYEGATCAIKQCDRKVHCKSMCMAHYTYMRSGRELGVIKRIASTRVTKMNCTVSGCANAYYSKGFCHTHYKALHYAKRGGDNTCTVPGCDFMHAARGYCRGHYAAWKTNYDAVQVQAATRAPEADDENP